MILFADLIKSQPGSSVHVRTALGNDARRRRRRPLFPAFIGQTDVTKWDDLDWILPLDIKKADPDQQLVFGWASVIEKGGVIVTDKQGDRIPTSAMEPAAYDFVMNSRDMGDMHEATGRGQLVESMMFTLEKQQALGIDLGMVGWWTGFKVSCPELWKAYRAGHRPEFSIGGSAVSREA